MRRTARFWFTVNLTVAGLVWAGPRAYVANSTSNDVSVIDTDANVEIDRISVGQLPFGVAVSPDGSFVYITNQVSNTVSIIDASTNEVVNTIAVGSQPYGVAFTPNGAFAYVANHFSDSVTEIDTQAQEVTAAISVAGRPWEVVVSTDGQRVYVSKNGSIVESGSVSVIDVQTHSVTEIPGESYAVSLAGDYAYFTHVRYFDPLTGEGPQLKVLDTTTNDWVALLQPMPGQPYDLSPTPDGTQIWVSCIRGSSGRDAVAIVDITNPGAPELIDAIDFGFGKMPREVAFSPNTDKAYVAFASSNTVGVLSTSPPSLIQEIPVGQGPTGIDIAP